MKHRILLLLLVCFALTSVKAQMETMMMNQWLNQMNMDTYRQQQQMAGELMKMMNQEVERQEANATAAFVLLPGGDDSFFAHITAAYIGLNNLEVIGRNSYGDEYTVDPSSYFASGNEIVTSSVFMPGTTVMVKRKDTGKVLSQTRIPQKGTTEYATFLRNARVMSQVENNINRSSPSFEGTSSSSRKTCSLCHGKGWIRGSSTATYGNTGTHWCSECGEQVNASHSHNKCPSCGGKGYIGR